ncbi:GNAT superfamily N-acetyltransferase [Elusimicrobium simillimum]|uniref:GNAT family N-acetyltransferase n=1 Tax=Elusimicrobium simillimum TaxID=3143438 RepID=UPI003C6EC4A5
MRIQTLADTSIVTVLNTFNEAFSDYVVPMCVSQEQLEQRIVGDSIDFNLSAGAFIEGELAGFVLFGFDIINGNKVAYNAVTGVIPSARGQRLTTQIYEHMMPVLRTSGVKKIMLEVISTNGAAIKIYNDLGFGTVRKLLCYKGVLNVAGPHNLYTVAEFDKHDWTQLKSFWDWAPSWQNSVTSVEKSRDNNIFVGVYDGDALIGYLVYNKVMRRVNQFAVDKGYRNKGAAALLLNYIKDNYSPEISITNVDGDSWNTAEFLLHMGLEEYVTQQEMSLHL